MEQEKKFRLDCDFQFLYLHYFILHLTNSVTKHFYCNFIALNVINQFKRNGNELFTFMLRYLLTVINSY